jgi:hypothetical protein
MGYNIQAKAHPQQKSTQYCLFPIECFIAGLGKRFGLVLRFA